MINPAAIRAEIERIYQEGVVTGDDGVAYSIRPVALTPSRGAFLRDLCLQSKAHTVLEIGMAWGLSSLHLEEALASNQAQPGAHVIVDPFQSSVFHNAALVSIEKLGLQPMIEFHEDFSELALPALIKQARLFDFIFIDGNHLFDGVFVDLVLADRLLKPGGIMVFDDTWSDGVFLACRYLETNLDYKLAGAVPQARRRRRHRLFRGAMRAYEKSPTPRERRRFDLAPFYDEVLIGEGRERSLRAEGLAALHRGERAEAREAFRAALRIKRRSKTYFRLLRTYLPFGLAARRDLAR